MKMKKKNNEKNKTAKISNIAQKYQTVLANKYCKLNKYI